MIGRRRLCLLQGAVTALELEWCRCWLRGGLSVLCWIYSLSSLLVSVSWDVLSLEQIWRAVTRADAFSTTAPPQVYYFECDLCNPSQIKTVAADVINFVGHPTVIINNAGFARGKSILDTTAEDLRLTYQINTLSHFYVLQQFLPELIKNNHGMVVTVASAAAYITPPRLVDYCGSKAAALSTHEGLQAELATIYKAPKVRTVVVCQGYTKTTLFDGFDKGDGFLSYALDTDTVAEAIAKAVMNGRSDHIVLPHVGWWISPPLRGTSLWWQTGLRKRGVNLMEKFQGRQVSQPSEKNGDKVEGSGVLV